MLWVLSLASLAVPEQTRLVSWETTAVIGLYMVRYDNNLPGKQLGNLPALLTALTSISQKGSLFKDRGIGGLHKAA